MGRFKDDPTVHWNQSGSEKWRRMGREGWKKEILTEISLQIWSWHEGRNGDWFTARGIFDFSASFFGKGKGR